MGGSAFNVETHGFVTSRMSRSQYIALSDFILPLLRLYFRTVAIPPEAPGKLTYGDLDVMVSKPLDLHPHDAILQLCSRALGSRCKAFIYSPGTSNIAVALGDVVVQVDVHVVSQEERWEIDYWMHSWGDMGMIVSSVIKDWGLRLSSSRGLWVESPAGGPLILSLNIKAIVLFLGLDWERYEQGFRTIEEIFEWIEGITINGERTGVKSKGKLEKRCHGDRPMWIAFWSRGQDIRYEVSDEERRHVFHQALNYFGKREEYEGIIEQLAHEKVMKEKFNGKRVMEWTGASGKALGELMKALRADARLIPAAVAKLDDERIKGIVMEHWTGLSRTRS